jgi:hypothetical protein
MYRDSFFDGDADIEMAELEVAGRAASRATKHMQQLRAAGRLQEAAAACPHGSGYRNPGEAAIHAKDPRGGLRGMRCTGCGSWWRGARTLYELRERPADNPCELAPE